jgi:hypothetical protein
VTIWSMWQVLMVAERTGRPEIIEEMDGELKTVIEDFDRAVNVEALRLAKETRKHLPSQPCDSPFSVFCVEQELLLGRLRSVEAGYDLNRRCMEGTRQSILNRIMDWVTKPQETSDAPAGTTYWLHGSPGIGKTSLAHSICERLHDRKHLAGSFFCRRDDPHLSDLTNILPTLINALAETFPPFRRLVADHLRKDRNLTSKSIKDTLFLDFIRNLPRHPEHPLVIIIDALDECGDTWSRPSLLKLLADAVALAPWLRIIITSRPEVDIQRFFDVLTLSFHSRYDLATDQEANADLRTFARRQFGLVASDSHLPTSWPEESDFNRVISRANGLFIFIKTLVLALRQCTDPEESLNAALHDSAATGLGSLYELYSSILKARIMDSYVEFRRVIGVLLTTASYRPLCNETIAELAGVKPNVVKKWVDDLSSLLYRDEHTNGVVLVRHLSVSDYFVSNECPLDYRVRLAEVNQHLGIVCIKTMLSQLRFNICKLGDSRLANADVKDLPSQIKENISECLLYSSLYWSNHLFFAPGNLDRSMCGVVKEFFEVLYPLFWIEVLSILEMVPVGAPSLRRVVSWLKVSIALPYHSFTCKNHSYFL